jgi:glycosyltransferase involved in cell wall biosynthesis
MDVLPQYRECIMGCVTLMGRILALKYAKSYITCEKTLSSLTSQQWMTLEAAACRLPVIHHGTLAKDDLRINAAIECPEKIDFIVEFIRFREDDLYRERAGHIGWRHVNLHHTFSHRLQTICKVLSIDHDWEEYPKASLITPTYRRDMLPSCLETFEQQTYPNKELILVFNGKDMFSSNELEMKKKGNDIKSTTVPGEMFAGACLNYGNLQATGKYCFRVDDDDLYGENYILDMILHAKSIDADLFGKTPAPLLFENDPVVYRRKVIPPMCVINKELLSNGNLWIGGNTIAGSKKFFQTCHYDDYNYGSADSAFLYNLSLQAGKTIAILDGFNIVAKRKADIKNHTWHIEKDELIKELPKSTFRIEDFFITSRASKCKLNKNSRNSSKKSIAYLGPLGFKRGVWDTRVKYIFPDLFEVLDKKAHISMITGPIPEYAKSGFDYLKTNFDIDVYEFPLVGKDQIQEKIIKNAWDILDMIRPDVVTNIFGGVSVGFPCGIFGRHWDCNVVLRIAGDEICSRLNIGVYENNSAKHLNDLAIEKNGFDLAHSIIAIAPWEQTRIRKSCKDGSKVKVCMRGVDLNRFSPITMHSNQNKKPFKILFVGRKSREKGFDIVEAVADEIFPHNPNIEFQFAGTFDTKVDRNKNYLGFVQSEDLPELYNRTDALILVSRTEGFPQVLAEAMSCGKPSIISKHIFDGFIKDGEEALLVDLDIQKIIQKILLLVNNRYLYQNISMNARKFAEEQLDKNVWKNIYRNIILGHNNFDDFKRLRFFTP